MEKEVICSKWYIAWFLLLWSWNFLLVEGHPKGRLGRSDFPPGFVFGAGSAAYQYEGAAAEDGRGPSIWDTFSHTPGKTVGGATGDVANDQYHRYKEDVKLMVNMGIDSYRFSISWTRIFPSGRGAINEKGVAYYNNLINELLKNGIQPFVTIYHWDLPQPLQDEYGGFLSHRIVEDFRIYARTCFELFGDRVKHWTTINEPLSMALNGYDIGIHAPGRCSPRFGNCTMGNSAIEPYIVAHNLLLSHATAVELYRHKYQAKQNGSIGITMFSHWFLPYDKSLPNKRAAQRILDFYFGWFIDPLTSGQYPASMQNLVGTRLPRFTQLQSQQLQGSFDFLGINYYTTMYAINDVSIPNPLKTDLNKDSRVNLTWERNGVLIGPQAGSNWLHVYPSGIRSLLNYIRGRYNNPPIFITENGTNELGNATQPLKESLKDTWRIQYHSKHLSNVLKAIRDGSDIRGYFAWTFLDDFEWDVGYSVRYGFHFIDRNNNLTRYPKESAHWFKGFLHH